VDRKRPHGRLAGLGESFLAGQKALARLVAEVASQPVPRRGVARIDRQHFAVKCVGLLERLGCELPSELDGLEIKRVGLRIGRARLGRRAEQCDLELLHYVGRDLVLDREDVVELAIVGLRPQVRVVVGLRETIMKAATTAPSTSSPIATAAQRTWARCFLTACSLPGRFGLPTSSV